jgi:predicted ATPase/DNA-binding SARP family transcriptional activator/DNA-binding XRE family transcriptional regulator
VDYNSPFGQWLKQRRKSLGLTQAELARRAHYSSIAIRKLEAGALPPSRQIVESLARSLDIPPAEFDAFRAFALGARPQAGHPARQLALHNLPAALTAFIGREQQIAELTSSLGASRLLTLVGAGGVGKTRLALALAAEVASGYTDGVYWVDLAPLSDPAQVSQVVAQAFDVKEQPGRPVVEALSAFLCPRRLLLVLDNCEHLHAASAQLAHTLLLACPGTRILATSREVLHVPGEVAWRVPSLTVPDPGAALEPDGITRYEAVALFVERARAALPGFTLTARNVGAVAQICWRLDGMPLAIELAAARVRVMTPEQIAEWLDDALRLLTAGSRTVLPRQQTLRATVEWSHDLLTAQERVLFRRLAVFAGPFTLEAAEAICPDGAPPTGGTPPALVAPDVMDALFGLVDKSMVLTAERAEGRETRYRLLETLRQYAAERLHESGEEAAVRRRQLSWFLALQGRVDAELMGHDGPAWLQRFETEHDNLRAVVEWALGLGHPDDAQATLSLLGGMTWYWNVRGHLADGRRWLERAVNDPRLASVAPDVRARALISLGTVASLQGDYDLSWEWLGRSVALAREHSGADWAWKLLAAGLIALGRIAYYRGDYARAGPFFEEVISTITEHGDEKGVPFSLNHLGFVALRQGRYGRAQELGERSLAMGRQWENKWAMTGALTLMARVALYQGHPEQAARLAERSLELSREMGHREDVADGTILLGLAARYRSDAVQAAALLRKGVAFYQETGDRRPTIEPLGELADLVRERGEHEEAVRLLTESLLIARDLQTPQYEPRLLEVAAALERDRNRPWRAARLLAASEALRAALGTPRPPIYATGHERLLADARRWLGAAAFAAAWAEGGAWPVTDVLAYAVNEEPGAPNQRGDVAPAPPLELYALGPVYVRREGAAVPHGDWKYMKAKELLFYLLSHPPCTREQVGADLWPDASPAQLHNNLKVTLHHLRLALGGPEWVVFDAGHYAFNRALGHWFDVEQFESLLARSAQAGDRAQSLRLLQKAGDLYRGDFLQDLPAGDWCLARREGLRAHSLEALVRTGHLLAADGHYARAAAAYTQAIAQDEYREEAHRGLIVCLARQGERARALQHYRALATYLRDELGAAPAPETAALAEKLRRGEPL